MAKFAIELENIWFWYESEEHPALRELNLSIPQGQFVALVGANGSGKSTLVKHLNGLLRPRRGTVRVGGTDAAGLSVGELAHQVGFLFQHPEQQIFGATVRQEVAFGPRNLGLATVEVRTRVQAALERFELTAVADRPPAILSYGQRRRVTLASLAAMDPAVVVLDEPTVGLDAAGLRHTLDWIRELSAQQRTILFVTHNMSLAAEHATRAIVLDQGQIIGDGLPRDLFVQPGLLARASLGQPPVLRLAQALQAQGMPTDSLSVEAFCNSYVALVRVAGARSQTGRADP
ncbi:MAG: ABC transporter ATP-binding protein [Anaerolineae bacterium]